MNNFALFCGHVSFELFQRWIFRCIFRLFLFARSSSIVQTRFDTKETDKGVSIKLPANTRQLFCANVHSYNFCTSCSGLFLKILKIFTVYVWLYKTWRFFSRLVCETCNIIVIHQTVSVNSKWHLMHYLCLIIMGLAFCTATSRTYCMRFFTPLRNCR